MNYPTLAARLQCGLPNSSEAAVTVADLRHRFGLTLSPGSVALVPNANICKPPFLMRLPT
ncbi:MAG: hypothetical protein HC866_15380 [Leptolyngbyaceae cyanobacterium RU_5_1]|nr:hypothetical protein [Leptolyngbyaceae cyanobacterium RU_5_1]